VERVYSPASGRDIDLALIVPAGVPSAGLPVCLALHWKGGSARSWLDLGLPAALTAAVRSGTPPFAVAAPDGEHYWIRNGADDPMRMLTDEVPQWLGQRGLSPQVSAAVGISMGGFGAWRYAREHRSLRAVATCSAALFTTWGDARLRKVFRDRTDWQSHEPLLHIDEVRGMPAGVWCGNSDPFAPANRRFARARTPEVAALGRGAHNIRYWRQVLPDVVRFLGSHLG
jgi:pimeloyl-ACP methyl ester carboxylesterase